MVSAEPLGKRCALRRSAARTCGMQIPVADAAGEIRAHPFGDQRVHHVERRDPAATGDAVAVDDEARLARRQMRKGLQQGRRVLPMNGKIASVQQTRRRQQIRRRWICRRSERRGAQAACRQACTPACASRVATAGADEDGVQGPNRAWAAIAAGDLNAAELRRPPSGEKRDRLVDPRPASRLAARSGSVARHRTSARNLGSRMKPIGCRFFGR